MTKIIRALMTMITQFAMTMYLTTYLIIIIAKLRQILLCLKEQGVIVHFILIWKTNKLRGIKL